MDRWHFVFSLFKSVTGHILQLNLFGDSLAMQSRKSNFVFPKESHRVETPDRNHSIMYDWGVVVENDRSGIRHWYFLASLQCATKKQKYIVTNRSSNATDHLKVKHRIVSEKEKSRLVNLTEREQFVAVLKNAAISENQKAVVSNTLLLIENLLPFAYFDTVSSHLKD